MNDPKPLNWEDAARAVEGHELASKPSDELRALLAACGIVGGSGVVGLHRANNAAVVISQELSERQHRRTQVAAWSAVAAAIVAALFAFPSFAREVRSLSLSTITQKTASSPAPPVQIQVPVSTAHPSSPAVMRAPTSNTSTTVTPPPNKP